MPDTESIQFDVDPRSVLGAIKQMNAALESMEKGSTSANAGMQRAIERTSDILLKVNDRSRSSLERLTQSIEKQAAAYGRTDAERMVAERDRIIKKLGDEQGMIDRVTASYAKMLAADATAAGGIEKVGFAANESKASLALMGEEVGIHIPRHLRTFITMLPGVGEALEASFKVVAVIALIAVIYEVIKKVLELRKALEEMEVAAERSAAEFVRFNDSQKLANDELKVTNDRLENAIAKLAHKPENNLKLAIDEAAAAADHLAERLDKSLHSFLELVQKNAPGTFAQIVGRQPSTKDISELVGGKSGFGGMIGDLYKATSAGENPTTVLAGYRERIQKLLDASEQSKAFQEGRLMEPGMTQPFQPGKGVLYNPALGPVDATQKQEPRIEVLNALIRQIDLLTQSYTLEKQNTALTVQHQVAEDAKGDLAKSAAIREMEQQFIKRMTEVATSPVDKIFAERDDLVRKGANKATINGAALSAVARELAKETAEENKAQTATNLKAAKIQGEEWQEFYKPLERTNADAMKRFKEMVQTQREILDIGLASERTHVTAESARGGRMAQLSLSGPNREMDAIAATYRERVDLAEKLHTFEMDRAAKELDLNKQKVDQARAEADMRKEMYDAGVDAELKLAELQKRRTDELAKSSTALWNTLLTKPGDFGKQLTGTIHAAVLKPVTEGLGNLTANALKPVIYGEDGLGGMAGMFNGMFGRQDPVKTATDQNTLATQQNSQAMYLLATLLARASGVSLSSLPTPAFIPGWGTFPHFAKGGVTNGPSIVGEGGPELVIPLPLDMRPTPYRPLVGTYGPETDAALLKAATAGMDIALPLGLSALGGPVGFSFGESLMSLIMGGAGAITQPRHDNVLLGIMPAGIGRGGRYSAPEEGRSLFGKDTYEELRAIGSKGGRASGLARRLRAAEAAEEQAISDAKYRGPEPGPIAPARKSTEMLDEQFPWLADAFTRTDSQLAHQAAGRAGARARTALLGPRIVRDLQEGQLKWAIDPKGRVRLSPFSPASNPGDFETYADWFDQIGLPAAGPKFDKIPRGYAHIDARGALRIIDNGAEDLQEGLTTPRLTNVQYDALVKLLKSRHPGAKLPSYDVGGTVAQTGLAVVHQGETVLPPSDTLKAAIDLNTAATVKAAQASQASAMYMAGVAATIASSVLGIIGLAAPSAAAVGGVVSNVALGSVGATGAPSGGMDVLSSISGIVGGPGGTPGFAGPVRTVGGSSSGGGASMGGGSRSGGGGASIGGFANLFKNLKTTDWGGFTRSGVVYGAGTGDVNGAGASSPGHISGMHGAAGAAVFAGGSMLAQQGLLGSSRGTWGGVAEGTVGGAAIGMSLGGPLGAAIGGAAGLGIGLGEKLAGVETKENEAKRLVKQIYAISIDNALAKQIAGVAQQSYGGNVGMAVRSDQVRDLLRLWAQSMGQKTSLTALTPHAASLIEANGKLYQGAVYDNGHAYTYASGLPTYGGVQSETLPTASPYAGNVNVTLNPQQTVDLWKTGTTQAMSGNPRLVSGAAAAGDQMSASRVSSAMSAIRRIGSFRCSRT